MNGTSRGEMIDEASRWIVGGGILTMALFPLALPALVLAAIAAIPLVVPALVIGLAWAAMVAAIRLTTALGRRAIGTVRPTPKAPKSRAARVRPVAAVPNPRT